MSPDRHPSGSTRWRVHSERLVDETRRSRWSIAAIELPDGVHFEQYVLRTPPGAVAVVLDDAEQVLMVRPHPFIIDQWVWELPGGFVDPDEDAALTADRPRRDRGFSIHHRAAVYPRIQPLTLSSPGEDS